LQPRFQGQKIDFGSKKNPLVRLLRVGKVGSNCVVVGNGCLSYLHKILTQLLVFHKKSVSFVAKKQQLEEVEQRVAIAAVNLWSRNVYLS
jgi:hypothetical protein